MNYRILYICWTLVIFNLGSCSPLVRMSGDDRNTAASDLNGQTEHIIFLTYSIQRTTTSGEYIITLENKKIADGHLKEKMREPVNPRINDLVYKALDKNSNVLLSNFIPNPLTTPVEVLSSEGTMYYKDLHLDKAQFLIRIPLERAMESIVLEIYNGSGSRNTQLLTTLIK